jgi:hypothetical protein
MNNVIFTLNINDYAPEIRRITRPLLERWAKERGYDIYDITERKFPEWDVDIEKLQIYDLIPRLDVSFAWYIDSDALVHPDLPPLHDICPRTHCGHPGSDLAPIRWRYTDEGYFQRDGRHIGSCCWNIFGWDWTRDIFHPPDDLTFDEAVSRIRITENEAQSGVITPSHLVTDYCVSRNIARYGLKFYSLHEALYRSGTFFYHEYTYPIEKKVTLLRDKVKEWKLG